MRITIIVATLAVAGFFLAVAGFGLWNDGRRTGRRDRLHELGMTEGAADRYATAVRIMERLDGRHDLSGVLAGDTLSTETHDMVGAWVSAHRREFADTAAGPRHAATR